jgi:hypothetical protein
MPAGSADLIWLRRSTHLSGSRGAPDRGRSHCGRSAGLPGVANRPRADPAHIARAAWRPLPARGVWLRTDRRQPGSWIGGIGGAAPFCRVLLHSRHQAPMVPPPDMCLRFPTEKNFSAGRRRRAREHSDDAQHLHTRRRCFTPNGDRGRRTRVVPKCSQIGGPARGSRTRKQRY